MILGKAGSPQGSRLESGQQGRGKRRLVGRTRGGRLTGAHSDGTEEQHTQARGVARSRQQDGGRGHARGREGVGRRGERGCVIMGGGVTWRARQIVRVKKEKVGAFMCSRLHWQRGAAELHHQASAKRPHRLGNFGEHPHLNLSRLFKQYKQYRRPSRHTPLGHSPPCSEQAAAAAAAAVAAACSSTAGCVNMLPASCQAAAQNPRSNMPAPRGRERGSGESQ